MGFMGGIHRQSCPPTRSRFSGSHSAFADRVISACGAAERILDSLPDVCLVPPWPGPPPPTAMPDLTRKQLEVLAFIRRFMDSDGLPPTRGEIAEGLGLKNRQGIDQHLRALES